MNPLLLARLRAAALALLGSLARHLLTAAGTALVTRGVLDRGTVDGIVPMAAEEIAGGVLFLASLGWGQFRAFLSHTRWAAAWAALSAASPKVPDDVAALKG